MPKEDIHGYIKTFIALIGAVAVVAIAGAQVKSNVEDIKINRDDIKVVKDVNLKSLEKEVHSLQLWQTESKGIAEGTLKTLSSIQAILESLRSSSNSQSTAIALIQKDLSNLEAVK